MRKLINVYIVAIFLMFVAILILSLFDKDYIAFIAFISFVGVMFTIIMALPLGDVKWHQTREDMIKEKKKTLMLTRNVGKFIEQIKKELFKKHIMSKEDVFKILDKES